MLAPFALETERLLLRESRVEDAHALFAMNAHPEVQRYTGEPPPESVEVMAKLIVNYQDYQDRGYGRLSCVLKSTSEVIGFCGLKKLPELGGAVDLGYRLTPESWGKGLATEASRACVAHGFETLALERIIGLVYPQNLASIRVLEKVGMRFDGEVEYLGDRAHQYSVRPSSDD